VNTILAVFAILVSLWAWVSARNARDGIARVLRLLNARVRPLVDEAEGHKPPTWRQVPPVEAEVVPIRRPQVVEEAAPRANGGEPPAAPQPGRAAPSPRPADKQTYHERRRREADDRLDRQVEQARTFLRRNGGEATPKEIRVAVGLPERGSDQARAVLRKLAADPDVETTGATQSRRYRLKGTVPAGQRQRIAVEADTDGRAAKLPGTPGAKSAPRQQPKVDGRILSAVQLMPKSARTLSDDLGIPLETVVKTLHALEAEGDVRRHDSGNWVLVP
jgi:hypothetical protein